MTPAKKKGAKKPSDNPDLGEVFQKTAEDDAEEKQQGEAAESIKRCHLLTTDAALLLACARKVTATKKIQLALLDRVMDLTGQIHDEAESAEKALNR